MNKKKELWKALLLSAIIFAPLQANAQDIEATLLLKQPGNMAVAHQLHLNNGRYEAKGTHLPLQISQNRYRRRRRQDGMFNTQRHASCQDLQSI